MSEIEAVFAKSPWRDVPQDRTEQVAHVPTMLAAEEQQLYYWLTAHWSQDVGEVVELGSYVGGSTARLAAGLQDAGKLARVFAYDHFRSDEATKERVLYQNGIQPFKGENILPLSKQLLAPWADRVVHRPGAIETKDWKGGPIEILVMDASKSDVVMDRMAETFFPHLIAGQSLVVQQDFYHWRLPWIPAQMRRLQRWFKPVAYCPNDTVVFLHTNPITKASIAKRRVQDSDDAQVKAALRQLNKRLPDWNKPNRIRKMIKAIEANPGVRKGYLMKRPER